MKPCRRTPGKRAFPTREAAETRLREIAEDPNRTPVYPTHCYRCPCGCDTWKLTHLAQPQDVRSGGAQ